MVSILIYIPVIIGLSNNKGRFSIDIFTIVIWIGTIIFPIFSLIKNKLAFGMGKNMILCILSIILLIGLILAFLPPEQIAVFVEKQNVLVVTIASAIFGTITLIPAFIAFPLVRTIVDAGVGIVPSVAFKQR